VKRRDLFMIVLAMMIVAAGAVLLNHYAFAGKSAPPTTTTIPSLARAYRACVADGETISTAIAAFQAQNPGLTATEPELLGNALGGPYLQSWANAPTFYTYSLNNGVLLLRGATAGSPAVVFDGPQSCSEIGL
jgi:ABC-type glycerol-3-phosphate transport system substrate-binding protein